MQFFLSLSAPRAEKSGNNRSIRGVHRDSAKRLRCTTSPSRRALWGDRRHSNNLSENVNIRIRAGRTCTSQCSPYQFEIRGNGTVFKYDCDHERHAGATKNNCLCTNQPSKAKRKHYCWSCGSNYTRGGVTCSSKKAGHQEESYYKKRMGGSEKGCEWRLGEIVNKIEISNPKISFIHYIGIPHNPTSTNILAIADSDANIHLARQATPTISPVIMENEMKVRLSDGSTVESTHIATLDLPGLRKQVRHIHIFQQMQTAPLISLGVLCYDGCTITLDKK